MERWEMDPNHSELMFRIRHLMITHITGRIGKFKATIEKQGTHFENMKVKVDAEADSLTTFIKYRDDHLKSDAFFEVGKFPSFGFESSSFKRKDEDGNFELKGMLTLKEISKPVTFHVHYAGRIVDASNPQETVTKIGFNIEGKIDRRDWGIDFNAPLESGGFILGDTVEIQAETEFILQ